jgi:hypothetical protein
LQAVFNYRANTFLKQQKNKKNMKKVLLVTSAILLLATFVNAQESDPELDYIKKAYSKDKKTIVEEYMQLNVQEAAKFWTAYGAYEKSREKLALEANQASPAIC